MQVGLRNCRRSDPEYIFINVVMNILDSPAPLVINMFDQAAFASLCLIITLAS